MCFYPHKGWLTKHTSYARSREEVLALADRSGLTISIV